MPRSDFFILPAARWRCFRQLKFGNNGAMLWIPLLVAVALLALIVLIFWSAWEPFWDDLKEDPVMMFPLVAALGAIVLLPPLGWAIALVT